MDVRLITKRHHQAAYYMHNLTVYTTSTEPTQPRDVVHLPFRRKEFKIVEWRAELVLLSLSAMRDVARGTTEDDVI